MNFATIVQRALRQRTAVQENGKRKMITKADTIGKQLVNRAASGDQRRNVDLRRNNCKQ